MLVCRRCDLVDGGEHRRKSSERPSDLVGVLSRRRLRVVSLPKMNANPRSLLLPTGLFSRWPLIRFWDFLFNSRVRVFKSVSGVFIGMG